MLPNETCLGSSHFVEGGGDCRLFTSNSDFSIYGRDYADPSDPAAMNMPAMCCHSCTDGEDCRGARHRKAMLVRSRIRREIHIVNMLGSFNKSVRFRLYPTHLTDEQYRAMDGIIKRVQKIKKRRSMMRVRGY